MWKSNKFAKIISDFVERRMNAKKKISAHFLFAVANVCVCAAIVAKDGIKFIEFPPASFSALKNAFDFEFIKIFQLYTKEGISFCEETFDMLIANMA